MSATTDLLKAVEAFRTTAHGNPRLASVMNQIDHVVLDLKAVYDSPGARASAQAQAEGGKYQQFKQTTFNGAGQESGYPSEEPGEVQVGEQAMAS